jgi:hypothetical protein
VGGADEYQVSAVCKFCHLSLGVASSIRPHARIQRTLTARIDPIDQTVLTYMDSGEGIPCDIVVLKDEQGNKIHLS